MPNYRKKIIKDEGIEEKEEGEYKKHLRRIKSSYSFSKTKYNSGFRKNHFNIDNSDKKEKEKNNKLERHVNHYERNNSTDKINISFSHGKNRILKNNLNKKETNKEKNKSKNNTKINFNIKSKTGGLAKFNPKNIKNKINNNNSNNKKTKNNNKEITNENTKIENDQNETVFYNNKPNKRKNKEETNSNVERKKENLLDNIHNLNINDIEKYSKVMISDFLIFVKKVCNEEKKEEDLSYHFNLIFVIFEKVLYRIIVLLNKEKKDKIIKLKKLLDDFVGNICKVIIITPCIDQIEGSNKFDNTLLETFMEKIKEFNKEKFYMNLLLSLYKFCERDEVFPPELNPKPAVYYFLNYLKNGYFETKSEKLLNVLKEFISETKFLNEQEKEKLLIKNKNEINNKGKIENEIITVENNLEKNNEEEENNKKMQNEGIEKEVDMKEENNKSIENENINDNNENEEAEEEEIKEEIYKNKIKDEILNNNNNDENEINKINTNNIMTKLRQFQEKLNNIPSLDKEKEKEKETTKSGTDEKNIKINENIKIENKKMEESEDSISDDDTIKENNNNNKNNRSNILRLNDNDFQKIEDSIKIMSKRLDNTLNKMNQVSSNRNNNRRTNFMNNINTNSLNNLNSINNSINVSKISENNNASIITSESYLKNNFININNNNKNKEIIDQMIKVIKGELNQINIFQKAKDHFKMLNSIEEKSDFIKVLKNNLNNPNYLEIIPINSCTNLFDFILTILSFQILNQSNVEQIIVDLQGISENLLNFRQLNDMFKIMLFLLKKYFPKNLNNKIEDISLVMIKVISYLLKELLKKVNKDNIIGKDIISEINDLFTVTPPSTLTTATPNAMFYKHIFTLLKSITDQIISNNKNELVNIIQYLQENKIVCEDYIQYLIKLQKKL